MLVMNRTSDNLTVRAEPLPVVAVADAGEIAGRYHARELEADLVIEARDGGAYAGFEGLLGAGPMERLHPVGPDVWIVTTRRSMDAPAPGDWTLQVRREGGAVTGLRLGCWLARRIDYARV